WCPGRQAERARRTARPRVVDGAPAYIVSGPTVRIEQGRSSLIASAKNPEEVVADIKARLR
ncbi:hypothetical protein FNY97_06925, partial [Corynebacterium hiratae]